VKSPEPRDERPPGLGVMASRYFALGLEMGFSVIIGFGVGYLVDRALHTLPWFTLMFSLLGAAAAFVDVYRAVRDLERDGVRRPKR
jgi:ATP synthase protein I